MNKYAIIAATPKCASTSVFHYLRNHPEISPSFEKEPNFFKKQENFIGDPSIEDIKRSYDRIFLSPSVANVHLDGSVTYGNKEENIKRIAQVLNNDDVKVIFTTRDPFERMYSSYVMKIRNGLVKKEISFDEYVKELHNGDALRRIQSSYFERYKMISQYLGEENIIVCELELLQRDPGYEMKRISEFLAIDAEYYDNFTFHHHNIGVDKRSKVYGIYTYIKRKIKRKAPFLHSFISTIYFFFFSKIKNIPAIEKNKRKHFVESDVYAYLQKIYSEDIALDKKELGIGGYWNC